MIDLWVDKVLFQGFNILQISCKSWSFFRFRNHLHQLKTICCKYDLKLTQIPHIFHYPYKCFHRMKRWETSPDVFSPIKQAKPSNVLYQPRPKKNPSTLQDPSVKHHLPGINGKFITSTCCASLCVCNTCASAQRIDYVSAIFSVSMGQYPNY